MRLTKDQLNVTITGVCLIILGVLFLIICLFSCSPYKKIAGDANPTEKEKSLLAIACARNFPVIQTSYNIDSVIKSTQKNYKSQIDSLVNVTEILDSIIHDQEPVIDTVNLTDTNCISRYKSLYQAYEKRGVQLSTSRNLISSLKSQIQSLQREYKPCDSLRIATSITNKCDSAWMKVLADRTKEAENKLVVSNTKLEDKKKDARTWMWTAIGLGAALIIGITLAVRKKFSKPQL